MRFLCFGKSSCKQCVKHVSMMSPRVRDVGRKPLPKQRASFFVGSYQAPVSSVSCEMSEAMVTCFRVRIGIFITVNSFAN